MSARFDANCLEIGFDPKEPKTLVKSGGDIIKGFCDHSPDRHLQPCRRLQRVDQQELPISLSFISMVERQSPDQHGRYHWILWQTFSHGVR